MILIDTDVVFDYFSGGASAGKTEQILVRSEAALSSISVFELFAGVSSQRHLAQREQFVGLCEVLELTASVARAAARLYSQLRDRGKLIANEDLFIAATALETGYPLFTRNTSHFERIAGLKLVP